MSTVCFDYLLPCVCAFLACVGFTLVFNIHGVGKLICGVGGALGWLVYLLAGSSILQSAPGTYQRRFPWRKEPGCIIVPVCSRMAGM